jgi:hypothetical protein
MYAGFWPTTLGLIPGNAVYIILYSFLREKLMILDEQYNGSSANGKQGNF